MVARVTPAGSAGLSVYVNSPSPPFAVGSVNEVIAWRCVHVLSEMVVENVGARSSAIVIVKVSSAASPSPSSAFHV